MKEEGEEESGGAVGGGINWTSFAQVLKKEVTHRKGASQMTQRFGRMGRHISRQFSTMPVYDADALTDLVKNDEALSILSAAHIEESASEQLNHHSSRAIKEELFLGQSVVANKQTNMT